MDMVKLREALEASWDEKTSYLNVVERGNPALGQCYPSSRIVQIFFPDVEIVEGQVWTGISNEKHFWNVLKLVSRYIILILLGSNSRMVPVLTVGKFETVKHSAMARRL